MEKLPLLQKILKQGTNDRKKCIIIRNSCYSGVNFILMVKEADKDNQKLIDTIKSRFDVLMESDYYLKDVLMKLEKEDNVFVEDHFFLEGIMFIVFKKEL